MKSEDFLFPTDLTVTPTEINRILIVGSCLSETFKSQFCEINPRIEVDHILFNNAIELPNISTEKASDYNLQYIQIPLRSILSDQVIHPVKFQSANDAQQLIKDIEQRLDAMYQCATKYYRDHQILTFVANFIIPQGRAACSLEDQTTNRDVAYLAEYANNYLYKLIQRSAGVYMCDLNAIASSIGKRYILDDMIFFYTHGSVFYEDWVSHEITPPWTAPERGRIDELSPMRDFYPSHQQDFFRSAYRQIEWAYRICQQTDQVKLVIFDLDNTLWRGQIGDHYGEGAGWPYTAGWPLGIWETINHLKSRGILTAICSKNDKQLVFEKWKDVVQPPFVEIEDFTSLKISWIPKTDMIAEILSETSLTAKSVVFVDDNPVERASIKAAYPQLRVIGSNPFLTRRILLWSSETAVPKLSDESRRRDTMIREQVRRETVRSAMSYTEFLLTLKTRVILRKIATGSDKSLDRIFELINKTNQFNTNGARWSYADLITHINQSGFVFTISVNDAYSDYGLVGAAIVSGNTIVQFVMSCRVLGMEIEIAALGAIVEYMRTKFTDGILGEVVDTSANMPCRDLYTKSGFSPAGHQGRFIMESHATIPKTNHIQVDIVDF